MEASDSVQNSQSKDAKEVPENSELTARDENHLSKEFEDLSVNDALIKETPAQGTMKEITDVLGKFSIDQKPEGDQNDDKLNKPTKEPQEESKIEKKDSNQPVEAPSEEVKLAENQFVTDDDSPMTKTLQTKRGVTLFGSSAQRKELEESIINGKVMLVIIISAIPDASGYEKRWGYLKDTINKYVQPAEQSTKNVVPPFKVVVLFPKSSLELYQTNLPGFDSLCSFVGYEIKECKDEKRPLNVGDARNAALLCGLLLKANHFILSDDDRYLVRKNKNHPDNGLDQDIEINQSIKTLQDFQEEIRKRIKNRALLGIASQANTISRKSAGSFIPEKKTRVAQLIVVNLEILKAHEISYLPVRIGEDNTFCFDVSKLFEHDSQTKIDEMWDWIHHSDTKVISIARDKANADIKNYKSCEYAYLGEMFSKILKEESGTYSVYWKFDKKRPLNTPKDLENWKDLINLRKGYFSLPPDASEDLKKL